MNASAHKRSYQFARIHSARQLCNEARKHIHNYFSCFSYFPLCDVRLYYTPPTKELILSYNKLIYLLFYEDPYIFIYFYIFWRLLTTWSQSFLHCALNIKNNTHHFPKWKTKNWWYTGTWELDPLKKSVQLWLAAAIFNMELRGWSTHRCFSLCRWKKCS